MWPPKFTLDQEKILNLLTGDRFYSNPSAALREAILNAIDAVHRRRQVNSDFTPEILAIFNRDTMTLTVADNGVGMSQIEVDSLFAKVGASAATEETQKESVGEFGIGVISYFMAGKHLRTSDLRRREGSNRSINLIEICWRVVQQLSCSAHSVLKVRQLRFISEMMKHSSNW